MCGIFGYIKLRETGKKPDIKVLKKAVNEISYRGPNNSSSMTFPKENSENFNISEKEKIFVLVKGKAEFLLDNKCHTMEAFDAINLFSKNLKYEINEKLSFKARASYDFSNKSYEQRHAAGSNATNTGTNGRWDYKKFNDELFYSDAILSFNDNYGDFSLNKIQKKIGFKRMFLHAGELGFIHPSTGEKCFLKAPLPKEFNKLQLHAKKY